MCSLVTEKDLFAVASINHHRVVALQTAFHQQPQSIVVIHLYVCVSGGVGCVVREHILSNERTHSVYIGGVGRVHKVH